MDTGHCVVHDGYFIGTTDDGRELCDESADSREPCVFEADPQEEK